MPSKRVRKAGDEPTVTSRQSEIDHEHDRAVTEYYQNRRILVESGNFPLDDGSTNAEST